MIHHTRRTAAITTTAAVLLVLVAVTATGCAAPADAEAVGGTQDALLATSSFTTRGTGYYPDSSALEGGFNDRLGKRLRTLQQFLAGSADYVSVAMDSSAFKYGTRLRIRELDAKYGRAIVFRVVDTGGAFRGKGRSRLDVCTSNRSASLDPTINGTLHVDVIDNKSAPEPPADDVPTTSGGDTGEGASSGADTGSGSGSGRACSTDGACNPGNDGSGEICSGGQCVSGCHTSAQCPGNTTCASGQCR